MIQYNKALITSVEVAGKVVLVRVDFNVPLDRGNIVDDARIVASLPTIRDLLAREAKQVVLLSHLGRPEGPEEALSLKPIKERLEALLGLKVGFSEPTAAFSSSEQLVLCENTRFWPGEESNSSEFAQELVTATGADLFVQDGFSVTHRKAATVEAITHLLPSYASVGLMNQHDAIMQFMKNPPRPLVAIIGGAKMSDKIGFIKQIIKLADQVFIGGALANTFLRAQGKPVGSSLVDYDQEEIIAEIEALAKTEKKPLFLPTDVRVAENKQAADGENKLVEAVLGQDQILDIGQASAMVVQQLVANAGAVIWNGPVGYVENPVFEDGSEVILRTLAATKRPALIGGGDTLAFVDREHPGLAYEGLVLSTGGGAMLDLLANGHLIGIDSLLDA